MPEAVKHHPLSASKAALWMRCTGYYALASQAPADKSNEFAAEGATAHTCAEQQLRGFLKTGRVVEQALGTKLSADGWDFEFNTDMREAVKVYVDYVRGLMASHKVQSKDVALEERVSIPTSFEGKYPEIGPLAGYLDLRILVRMNCLYIVDYKHGKNVLVDVENNYQLQFYALAAWLAMPENVRRLIDKIHTVIVQPRGYSGSGIKLWTYNPEDIEVDFYGRLKTAVDRIVSEDYELVAGSHCREYFCQNRSICAAYQDYAKNLPVPARRHGGASDFADVTIPGVARAVVKIPVTELTNDQLSALVVHANELEKFLELAKSEALNRIEMAVKQGSIPGTGYGLLAGVSLVKKRSDRGWGDNSAKVRLVFQKLNVPERNYAPPDLLTPPALEKRSPELFEKVKDLVVKPDNGMTLKIDKPK